MKVSERIAGIAPSATLAIDSKYKAMKAEGLDVIGFGAGEPDFDTPDPIKQAAKDALDAGFTKYTPTPGIPDLRKAVVGRYKKDYGLTYAPEQSIVTCGGKHALYEMLQVLVDPGDEVIIPAPYWVSYPPMVELAGGVPVILRTDESMGFTATAEAIEKVMTPKTKAFILNSPSNPTGGAYSREALQDIARLCIEKDLFVISDEIYEKIVYDGYKFQCFAQVDERLADRCIITSGLAKTYAMTGWRIGYAVGPKELIGAMTRLQSHSTSNITSIAQKAAIAALKMDDEAIRPMLETFGRRRALSLGLLANIKAVTCYKPQGAFYVFPKVSNYYGKKYEDRVIESSNDLCAYLLDKALVAAVPGGAFGADDNIRLSYATSDENILKGVGRISEALSKLK